MWAVPCAGLVVQCLPELAIAKLGRKHPVIRRSVSFGATSSFFTVTVTTPNWGSTFRCTKDDCESWHTNGGFTSPHGEPARQSRRLLRAWIFWHRPRRVACSSKDGPAWPQDELDWGCRARSCPGNWLLTDALFLYYLGRKRLMLFWSR